MPSTTELIKELRDKTGAGIMECKKAIEDVSMLFKKLSDLWLCPNCGFAYCADTSDIEK